MEGVDNFFKILFEEGSFGIARVQFIVDFFKEIRLRLLFGRLLKDRIIFVGTPINDQIANLIIAQMLFLASEDPKKDIALYLNTPGGIITAGMAIYDTMQYIPADVATICIGQASSMGAVLLAGGAKGKRQALPDARAVSYTHLTLPTIYSV